MNTTLYEQDYYQWLTQTSQCLKTGDFSQLDLPNLIEEIDDMGISQKRAVSSNLRVVLWHLLKYKYQPQKRTNSWRFTIYEHQRRLLESFKNSPSLKPYFQEIFDDCYQSAREAAARETELPIEIFPEICPFSQAEALDKNYLPE